MTSEEIHRAVRVIGRLALVIVAVAAALAMPMYWLAGVDGVQSWLLAAGVSLFNCIWGTVLLLWGLGRGNFEFQLGVIGGFVGRMIVTMVAFGLLLSRPGVDAGVLLASLIGFYFMGVLLERRLLTKEVLTSSTTPAAAD